MIALKEYSYIRLGICYILCILIPLFINPTLGLVLGFLVLCYSKQRETLLVYFSFILALWISLINVTKEPVSDQYRYMESFKQAAQIPFEYWWGEVTGGNFKEPIFYIFTYISQIIFLGNEKFYFFFISLVNYIIIYYVSIRFSKAVKVGFIYSLTAIVVITFFTQYFTLTLHIIRQILAATIVFSAIVLRAIDGKKRYFLLICGALIHSSVILLVLLSLIPWFYKKMNLIKLLICGVSLLLFVILFGLIGSYLMSNLGEVGGTYVLSRMKEGAIDTVGQISMIAVLIVLLPMILISIKLLLFDLPRNHYGTMKNNDDSPFYPIIYIFLIFSIFILAMSKSPLIQYRFFMMSYVFIPFIMPYLIYKTNILHKVYLISLDLFFIIRFILLHNTGEFQYAPIIEIFALPLPFML